MKKLLISIGIVAAMVGAVVLAPAVGAEQFDPCDLGSGSSLCNGVKTDSGDVVKTVIQVLLWVVGILSVIMIIVGAIQYVTSAGGDGVKKGKNTIIYAVVGLVVAIFAYAIVAWVFDRATGQSGPFQKSAVVVQRVEL